MPGGKKTIYEKISSHYLRHNKYFVNETQLIPLHISRDSKLHDQFSLKLSTN